MPGGFNVGSVYGGLKLETAGFKKSVNEINTAQDKMTTKASGANSAFKGLWKQMAAGLGVGMLLTSAIRGIVTQFKDIIEKGGEFESTWANVTTMMTLSKDETDKMKGELLKLSPVLGDTKELAEGMYQVLSASIEPAKAIEFLGTAAMAATAGLTDVFTSVDALTTVINAYGMEAEQATEVSDIMFQTVKRGKLTFGELAHSLGTVVPVAATLGVDFEEIAAAISAMTRQGIPAQTATMQLRQVLMSILKPSEQAKKAAEELGLEWNVDALEAKGLAEFLLDLKKKVGDNTEVFGQLVPNVRALTGVMVLAGKASAGFTTDLGLMEDASGAMETAFRKQMETADFWIKAVGVTVDKFKISFYQGLVDPMLDAAGSTYELEAKLEALSLQAQQTGHNIGEDLSRSLYDLGLLAESVWTGLTKGINAQSTAWTEGALPVKEYLDQLESRGLLVAVKFQRSLTNFELPLEHIRAEMEKGKEHWEEWSEGVKRLDEKIGGLGAGMVTWKGINIKAMVSWRDYIAAMTDAGMSTDEIIEAIIKLKEKVLDANEPTVGLTKLFKELSITTRDDLNKELEQLESILFDDAAQSLLTERQIAELAERAIALREELKLRLNPALNDLAYELGTTVTPEARNLDGVLYNLQTTLKNAKYETAFDKLVDGIYRARDAAKITGGEIIRSQESIARAAEEAARAAQEAWEYQYRHWLTLADNMAWSFGGFVDSVLTKGSDLKDALDGLWNDIQQSFRTIISDYITEQAAKLFKSLISGAVEAGKKTAEGLGGAIAGVKESALSLAKGFSPGGIIASAITGAISGFISGIIGGKTYGKNQVQLLRDIDWWIQAMYKLQEQHILNELYQIKDDRLGEMFPKFDAMLSEFYKIRAATEGTLKALTSQGTVFVNVFKSKVLESMGDKITGTIGSLDRDTDYNLKQLIAQYKKQADKLKDELKKLDATTARELQILQIKLSQSAGEEREALQKKMEELQESSQKKRTDLIEQIRSLELAQTNSIGKLGKDIGDKIGEIEFDSGGIIDALGGIKDKFDDKFEDYDKGERIAAFQHGGVIEAGPRQPTFFRFGEGSERERAVITHVGKGSAGGGDINIDINFNEPFIVRSDEDVDRIKDIFHRNLNGVAEQVEQSLKTHRS